MQHFHNSMNCLQESQQLENLHWFSDLSRDNFMSFKRYYCWLLRRIIIKSSLLSVHHRSCISDPNSLSGRHDSQVWDLGHRGSGEVPQSGPHVLQGSPGRHRGLWHNQRWHLRESKVMGEGASETGSNHWSFLWLMSFNELYCRPVLT